MSTCRRSRNAIALIAAPWLILLGLVVHAPAQGAESPEAASVVPPPAQSEAPVVVDGRALFRVAGVSAFPAPRRAGLIMERIETFAQNAELPVDSLRTEETSDHVKILAGEINLLEVHEVDARLEGLNRSLAARVIASRIKEAVADYRRERSLPYLLRTSAFALAATSLMVLVLWLLWRGLQRAGRSMEGRYRERVKGLRIQSFEIMQAEQFWGLARVLPRLVWWLAAFVLGYFYLERVLSRFPWTRGFANWLLQVVLDPLRTIGSAVVKAIPDLVFVAILVLVVRYILKLTRLFFLGVAQGSVELRGFEREWAMPTYALVRFAIVAFAAVVSFPYLPGSSSDAFKGISVFVGVLFSIGSSSIVSDVLAGYNLIYRRAFRVGDRVMIGQYVGDVAAVHQQVTHLVTPKNEEIVIPNSKILQSEIVNYSTLAREGRLVLHTSVTIGYDTPWRQVEAMLLEAARRTPDVLGEPPPFVLKKALGDFYVEYELNACSGNASAMARSYSVLHQNILDVFNEHGVQIMSPHFEAQPDQAVIVPKDQWYAAPAQPPAIPDRGA